VALASCDHAYIGVRPADATPIQAPCFILAGRSATCLADVMLMAGKHWPTCSRWALIASDEQLKLSNPEWPPTMHALQMPATLTTFGTVDA
jgi:hypothetical protein